MSSLGRRLASFVVAILALPGAAAAGYVKIELTPTDVGSSSSSVFSTLPTDGPSTFGMSGDVRGLDFDFRPDGTAIPSGSVLTTEYASLGVQLNGILVRTGVFGGPASSPNTTFNGIQVFTFTVPVTAVGIINTSPDQDLVEILDTNGNVVLSFRDQEGLPKNFNVDRFVGARATGGDLIGGLRFVNNTGDIELDEMIFEVAAPTPEPAALGILGLGLAVIGLLRGNRRRWPDASVAA